jgi:endonuclease/exonuclease/phosphatase family metal-dependent hydrolase
LRIWAAAILVAAVVAILWGHGHRHLRVDYASGNALYGQTQEDAADRSTIRVATFNIHGAKGGDGVRDLNRVAECLQGFDVVGMNEVNGPDHLFSDRNQAEALSEVLRMAWLFAPTEQRWWRDCFGNGMLSRLAVTHWERLPLTGTRHKGHRNVVFAVLPWQDRTLHVLITHLDRHFDRTVQLHTIVDMFLALPPPAVLMGDLNTLETDPQILGLRATPGVAEALKGLSGAGASPRSRVDWIFVRGLEVVDGGMLERGASDHPCVWAEFRLATAGAGR